MHVKYFLYIFKVITYISREKVNYIISVKIVSRELSQFTIEGDIQEDKDQMF